MFPKNLLVLLLILTACAVILLFYLNKRSDNEFELQEPTLLRIQNRPFNDLPQKLLDIPFTYILNNKNMCNDNDMNEILAVFIITSYFGNVETRSAMRRSFSGGDLKKYNMRRVFLLGEAPKDKYTTQKSVTNEFDRFKDIIQGNFSEAYRNLTYKHVMGLKWVSTYCWNAKYIIKMDDDIVINMYNLKSILHYLDKLQKDFIAGYILRDLKPIREPANKWYVTKEEYSPNYYPSFVSGWFYVTKPQTARKIVTLSNYEKYFWIDDVFVTGILTKKLKIMQYDISKHFTANSEFLQCCIQDFDKNLDCDINIGPNGGDNNMFFEFNSKVKKCFEGQCTKRLRLLNETCVAKRKINLGKGDVIIRDFKLI